MYHVGILTDPCSCQFSHWKTFVFPVPRCVNDRGLHVEIGLKIPPGIIIVSEFNISIF